MPGGGEPIDFSQPQRRSSDAGSAGSATDSRMPPAPPTSSGSDGSDYLVGERDRSSIRRRRISSPATRRRSTTRRPAAADFDAPRRSSTSARLDLADSPSLSQRTQSLPGILVGARARQADAPLHGRRGPRRLAALRSVEPRRDRHADPVQPRLPRRRRLLHRHVRVRPQVRLRDARLARRTSSIAATPSTASRSASALPTTPTSTSRKLSQDARPALSRPGLEGAQPHAVLGAQAREDRDVPRARDRDPRRIVLDRRQPDHGRRREGARDRADQDARRLRRRASCRCSRSRACSSASSAPRSASAPASLACWFGKKFGIPLNPDVYYIDRMPVHVEPNSVILTAAAGVLISMAATFYPALLAARVRPAGGNASLRRRRVCEGAATLGGASALQDSRHVATMARRMLRTRPMRSLLAVALVAASASAASAGTYLGLGIGTAASPRAATSTDAPNDGNRSGRLMLGYAVRAALDRRRRVALQPRSATTAPYDGTMLVGRAQVQPAARQQLRGFRPRRSPANLAQLERSASVRDDSPATAGCSAPASSTGSTSA